MFSFSLNFIYYLNIDADQFQLGLKLKYLNLL